MTAARQSGLATRRRYRWLNIAVVTGSALLCILLLPMRLPGMQLLGVSPSWLLIWVVAWSVQRTGVEGAIAGLTMGIIHDGLTGYYPSQTLGLALVGFLTARIQRQRIIQEDFVYVALIVFGMTVIAQTMMALQISAHRLLIPDSFYPRLPEIWLQHQRIALSSAILSSLWATAVYYPLSRWWTHYHQVMEPPGG
ncbi:rod shape-determining protein MreD [Oscillatoria sp. CS-180]|uniref:rod shape-determining protein MreD n=1 Tax=Oscillatoria sp. CS-180 TaxID=3021720 RepID=UPI00232D6197|nr:rod shape-determining protein MreD [Oscillatoria sp. CS-180]MDB9529000.1 rod shape-determining protein MreD [Oscillatoria sp. CS-180]